MKTSKKGSRTIRVSGETYEALMDLGSMRDTFEDVIRRLIKDGQKWRSFEKKVLRDLLIWAEAEPDREAGTYGFWKEILMNFDLVDEEILKEVKNSLRKAKGDKLEGS